MEQANIRSRLETLRARLKARDGTPGYEKNCEVLRAEIARLEGKISAQDAAPVETAEAAPASGKSARSASRASSASTAATGESMTKGKAE